MHNMSTKRATAVNLNSLRRNAEPMSRIFYRTLKDEEEEMYTSSTL